MAREYSDITQVLLVWTGSSTACWVTATALDRWSHMICFFWLQLMIVLGIWLIRVVWLGIRTSLTRKVSPNVVLYVGFVIRIRFNLILCCIVGQFDVGRICWRICFFRFGDSQGLIEEYGCQGLTKWAIRQSSKVTSVLAIR